MTVQHSQSINHSMETTNLADLLERILDKGVVIAGDIKIKLVDIELLTIQIRLVVCSVDKAMEMGMDWWVTDPNLCSLANKPIPSPEAQQTPGMEMQAMNDRLARLEGAIQEMHPLGH